MMDHCMQRLFLSWILLALVALPSCNRRPRVPPPLPAPPPPPAYLQAERDFEGGRYLEAAHGYRTFLDSQAAGGSRERAAFRLALAQALSGPAGQSRAADSLRRFVTAFPRSGYRPEADLLLQLFFDLKKLRRDLHEQEERSQKLAAELERLKKIDLQRRTTRPPPRQ